MNTDVRQGEAVLHVQTEDLGGDPVRIQTLVYQSGRILRSIEKDHADVAAAEGSRVRERLMQQHRTVIQAIVRGRIQAEEGAKPAEEPAALVISPLETPRVGSPVSLLILLREGRSFKPLQGRPIEIRFLDGTGAATLLHTSRTDAKGFHLAEFDVPDAGGTSLTLQVNAGSEGESAQGSLPVAPSHQAWLEPSGPGQAPERIDLVVADMEPVMAGHDTSLMILARGADSCLPVAGAEVRILYSEEVDDFRLIYEGATDERGIALAGPRVPITGASRAMLTIEARSAAGTAEVVLPVFIPSR